MWQRLRSNRARLSLVRRPKGVQPRALWPGCNVRVAVCLGSRLHCSHYLCSWWHNCDYPRSMVGGGSPRRYHGAHWLRPTRGAWHGDRLRERQVTAVKLLLGQHFNKGAAFGSPYQEIARIISRLRCMISRPGERMRILRGARTPVACHVRRPRRTPSCRGGCVSRKL